MRNEVFGRILYLFVNTCFAKACIRRFLCTLSAHTGLVDSLVVEAGLHVCSPGEVNPQLSFVNSLCYVL
jgi:hypothetical protein